MTTRTEQDEAGWLRDGGSYATGKGWERPVVVRIGEIRAEVCAVEELLVAVLDADGIETEGVGIE